VYPTAVPVANPVAKLSNDDDDDEIGGGGGTE
jgi:hypothetical protein